MKKALAILLVMVLLFSMVGTAFAYNSVFPLSIKAQLNKAKVKQENTIVNSASAISGWAIAEGNFGKTWINSNSSASSCGGDGATSNSTVAVVNQGDAAATSGDATATNNAENNASNTATIGQANVKTVDIVECCPGNNLPPLPPLPMP